MAKKKKSSETESKATGGTMHYPAYRVSTKQLKMYAASASTPEMRRAILREIKK